RVLLQEEHDLGPMELKLPASFRIPAGTDPGPVLIRGVGSKDGTARIQRDAVTPIPRNYVGQLRLPLNYLCDGTAQAGGSSTCAADDETCVLGMCKRSGVPTPRAAVDVSSAQGEGEPARASDGSFDVAACFADPVPLTLDLSDCTAEMPDGIDERTLN